MFDIYFRKQDKTQRKRFNHFLLCIHHFLNLKLSALIENCKALFCVTVNKDILSLKKPFVFDVNVSNIYLDLDVYQEKMTARARVVVSTRKHNRNITKIIIILQTQTHYNTAVTLLFWQTDIHLQFHANIKPNTVRKIVHLLL